MIVDPELFAAFCLAVVVLILMPGPVVTLVVANSLKHGTRTGVLSSLGASGGNLVLILAAAAGITTVMALVAEVFFVVRWVGAAYLIWLGVREWRSGETRLTGNEADPPRPVRSVLGQGFLIGVTNPKTILFYLAFFPQFVDPALPAAPQLAAMVAAFMVIATSLDATYALLAGTLRRYLADMRFARLRARITGSLLIATGVGLALARR